MRVPSLVIVLTNMISAAEPAPVVIALQPLGEVKAERLSVVRQGLEKAYGLKLETLSVKPLPKAAWYEPRAPLSRRYPAG